MNATRVCLTALTLAVATLAASGAVAHPHRDLAISVGRAFDGQRWLDRAVVVVRDHDILSVTAHGRVPAGMKSLVRPDAVLTPGLFDLDSRIGIGHRRTSHEATSPDLRVVDGYAPEPEERHAFLRSGVTTAWLAPNTTSVMGGAGALVQPTRVLSDTWGFGGSLSSESSFWDRAPTALPERSVALRRALSRAPSRTARRDRVWVQVDDPASARQARDVPGAILVGLPETGVGLGELIGRQPVVLSGLGPASSQRQAASAAALRASGVLIGFGSGGHPSGALAVRHAAARAVSEGLPAADALAALTGDAARLAGIESGRGTLRSGAPADLVLWSGDPVQPTARPLVVWLGGEEVFRGE